MPPCPAKMQPTVVERKLAVTEFDLVEQQTLKILLWVANRGVSKNKYLLAIWDLETGVERTEWFHVQRDENQWWGKNGLDLHFWQPIIGAKCGNVMCKLCLPNMICFLSMYW